VLKQITKKRYAQIEAQAFKREK